MDDSFLALEERKASANDVIMNTVAAPVVRYDKNVAGPRLPNMVWEDPPPPKAAPIDPPLPTCKSTTRTSVKATRMWRTTTNAVSTFYPL